MDWPPGTDFWIGLLKIIGINIVLSGDNAVVIALAARGLPAHQRSRAIVFGSAAAVVMRVVLTVVVAKLLALSYLQLLGGALLLWIGVQLLAENSDNSSQLSAHGSLMAAVRTILVADLIMSMDNVIAVAAAAKGSTLLLLLGLALSIPMVVFASSFVIWLMDRLPWVVTLGAALIGWVAGETMMGDVALRPWVDGNNGWNYLAPALGAVLVVWVGQSFQRRHRATTK